MQEAWDGILRKEPPAAPVTVYEWAVMRIGTSKVVRQCGHRQGLKLENIAAVSK